MPKIGILDSFVRKLSVFFRQGVGMEDARALFALHPVHLIYVLFYKNTYCCKLSVYIKLKYFV